MTLQEIQDTIVGCEINIEQEKGVVSLQIRDEDEQKKRDAGRSSIKTGKIHGGLSRESFKAYYFYKNNEARMKYAM